jgi:hypothetical protein
VSVADTKDMNMNLTSNTRQAWLDLYADLTPGQQAHADRLIDAGYGVEQIGEVNAPNTTVIYVNVNDHSDRKWATYSVTGHVFAGRI